MYTAPETSFTGAIPATFGNLVDLQELDLSLNALDGALPEELGQLTKLERVALYGNGKWFGVIIRPLLNYIAHIYLLPSHIILALTGALPESIGNWESVTDVDMSENSFSSDSGLPTTIGNWKLIEKLQFFNSGELMSSSFNLRLSLLLI